MTTTGIKYDIEMAIDVSSGKWEMVSDARGFAVVARGADPRLIPTLAAFARAGDAKLAAASKDLAQAALGAERALLLLQRDPDASLDFDSHLRELDNALAKAGFPARKVERGKQT